LASQSSNHYHFMQRHFDQDLIELKEKLLTMASHAETGVAQAMKALADRDDNLALEVKQRDAILDRFEIDLDELCINLLALKAPLASDLRLITVAMKVTQNLERVGDETTKIAKRALDLNREEPLKPLVDIPRMAALATEMLRSALDAFVRGDTARARALVRGDAEVDALNKQLHRELVGFMVENPATITRCLHWMVIAKSLERIADHATNIAEEVVFLYEGTDIRHAPKNAPGNAPAPSPANP
jgi:phosphate transport system protein